MGLDLGVRSHKSLRRRASLLIPLIIAKYAKIIDECLAVFHESFERLSVLACRPRTVADLATSDRGHLAACRRCAFLVTNYRPRVRLGAASNEVP